MLRLFLTRHGETEWNVQRISQGRKDSKLTELGVGQAELLYGRLKNIDFNRIYSSISGRAVKTAEIVRGDKDTEIVKCEKLMEISMGDWEGKKFDDIKKLYPERLSNFWEHPELYTTEDGETFYDVQVRVVEFINDIRRKHADGDFLIVTHGITLKVIMSYFQGKNINELWEGAFMQQTCLNVVEIEKNKNAVVRMYGDVSHY
ncbi:MAG: histidine phosphatase family protein [Alkaliphilus sp.]|nr:MAG: histidine phosphatase family protein [Alkaliphilus sp.]